MTIDSPPPKKKIPTANILKKKNQKNCTALNWSVSHPINENRYLIDNEPIWLINILNCIRQCEPSTNEMAETSQSEAEQVANDKANWFQTQSMDEKKQQKPFDRSQWKQLARCPRPMATVSAKKKF